MTENIDETNDSYEDSSTGWSWGSFFTAAVPLAFLFVGSLVYSHNSYYDGKTAGISEISEQIGCRTIKCRLDEAKADLQLATLTKQKNDIDLEANLATTKEQAAANKIIIDSMPKGVKLEDIRLNWYAPAGKTSSPFSPVDMISNGPNGYSYHHVDGTWTDTP